MASRCLNANGRSPPDHGWSWVVLAASFLNIIITDGICFTFGVFLPEIMNSFQSSKGVTSWAMSLVIGVCLLVGPLVGALIDMYGCRKVAIVGGLISAAGLFICSFSPNVEMLIVVYGIVGGFGIGLAYLPSVVVIGFYFKKKRGLATGICVCGAGAGTFIFAPVGEILLSEYGWRGSHWILGGLLLHVVAFSGVFRPIHVTNDGICANNDAILEKHKEYQNLMQASEQQDHDLVQIKAENTHNTTQQAVEVTQQAVDVTQQTVEAYSEEECNISLSPNFSPIHSSCCILHHVHEDCTEYCECALNDLDLKQNVDVPSTNIINTLECTSESNATKVMLISKDMDIDVVTSANGNMSESRNDNTVLVLLKGIKKRIFNTDIIRNPMVLLFGLSTATSMMGYFVPFAYLPITAQSEQISRKMAAFLISIIGISTSIGRVGIGYAVDKHWVDAITVHGVCTMTGGIITALLPLYSHYALLASYSAAFGICSATFACLSPIIIIDLVGLEQFPIAFGFLMMCSGGTSLVGPPIAGFIADATGSFDGSFYFSGVMLFVGGALMYPLKMMCQRNAHRQKT